ncbi:hypothetical protein QQS21_011145 [Conoideocrella luteorostrata]|uniref:Uncharacterized protein n=1 Tax=Conoideocrella luteorostrata TaxID=1105319 RepID=A0AAJ0CGE9_9HYPO|nr:hypothetical protein QQS21_011145 [Conoideocrella luteorostrata]
MSSILTTYGTNYGNDASTRTSSFGDYNAGMMMNHLPPRTEAEQAAYNTQEFTQRHYAVMEMMPPLLPSGYFTSDTSCYRQNTGMGQLNTMFELKQPSGVNPEILGSRHADVGATASMWSNYRRQLGTVFRDVADGQLERASGTMLELSQWLLTRVVELGLHQDNPSLHEVRLSLWDDFNHGWLALAFQQKELMTSRRNISNPRRLMTKAKIEELGDELVRLCDRLERHGLVDYQYGVWEEQIEAALEECLDVFEDIESRASND